MDPLVPRLRIADLFMAFGGVVALRGVSLEVHPGEILSVIGPNGAGKTVLLNCINGLYRPQRGRIFYDGQEITGRRPHERARLGLSRTFQKIELFLGMTVLDNIRLGRHVHMRTGLLQGAVYHGPAAREEEAHRAFIEREIIDLLEIHHVRDAVVGMLPYGIQKRVELARALALAPRLLLLDEPMAGLNLEETEDMARFIIEVNESDRWQVTCVLVEHDMGVVMDISHRVVVLNFGEKITEGSPAEVQANPEVVRAYLGEVEGIYATRR
ncbi:MAG: ABC transporter ATP-binding protein [Armatimonadetes bacterium RBG_16_67_12]|nr:MAG: ABC transporter ATP-binding protein [Armatimonadetes bacterium RBG_16_67_12]